MCFEGLEILYTDPAVLASDSKKLFLFVTGTLDDSGAECRYLLLQFCFTECIASIQDEHFVALKKQRYFIIGFHFRISLWEF
jgi:hypothetical protein